MKNILVTLLLLVTSQMLVAVSQEMKLELNDPNDCGYLEKSILPYILPNCSISEEDVELGINVKPEKNKVVESNNREKYPNQLMKQDIIKEWEEEIVDLANYGVLLWCKLKKLEIKVNEAHLSG